jgi:uncharacterized membrane protein YozB (DUF420 family)
MGFLGTGAPFKSDINLIVQLLMGGALLVGMALARGRRYRAHALCQGSVIALNLVMIGAIMLPPFWSDVLPGIPRELGKPYYSVAAAHAALGAIAELLGVYVLLVAGTNWLPERLRFQNYKLWMRATLALWWSVIGLGIATYYVWL